MFSFSRYKSLILATHRPLTRRVDELIPNSLNLSKLRLLNYNPSTGVGSEIGKSEKSELWWEEIDL